MTPATISLKSKSRDATARRPWFSPGYTTDSVILHLPPEDDDGDDVFDAYDVIRIPDMPFALLSVRYVYDKPTCRLFLRTKNTPI